MHGRGKVDGGKQWCEKTGPDGKAVKEGPFTAWFTPTQKRMEGVWKDGLREGRWTAWYPNGQRKDEGEWKDGHMHGQWSYWHLNGRLQKRGNRRSGKREGTWTTWYPNGKIETEAQFSNGVKKGRWRRYHKNGKIAEQGRYKNDTRKGKWTFRNAEGVVVRTATYDYPNNLSNHRKSAAVSTEQRPEGQNLLLIVVDALRADGLNPYGYDKPTSPALAALASEGILYEDVHAAAPWTAPSFATIMTGVSPTVHHVGWRLYRDDPKIKDDDTMSVGRIRITRVSDGVPNIAQMLAAKKLKRGAIVNNAFLHPSTGLSTDFDYYDLIIPNEKKEKKYMAARGNTRKATEVTNSALTWLEAQKKTPFFLLLHYFDPHVSYSAPKKYQEQFATFDTKRYKHGFSDVIPVRLGKLKPKPEERRQIRAHYDAEVRYTDDEIGRLLRRMEAMGLLDNTWVVFTADHGEELFDHGYTDHGHRYEEEVTRVPLIIRAPGGKWNAGVRVDSSARHIDIVPTILDALGLNSPEMLEGKSVFSLLKDKTSPPRPAYMEYNLYWGQQYSWYDGKRFKLIEPLEGDDKKGFVYDLKRDPKERNKIYKGSVYERLKKAAETHRAHLKARANKYAKKTDSVVLSKEVEESLRQLGYIED